MLAVPANNEAAQIAGCLAAVALQRDESGLPIPAGSLEVLVFANNCSDETASVAREFARLMPHPTKVIEEQLPAARLSAGWARKRAMDLAAMRLAEVSPVRGLILTTDADSRVAPTWFAANLREFDRGADCVAGYIDAIPTELLELGTTFLARSRLEDTYLSYLAEIDARCDPRPHDPWPNHRVSSGASLAVTLAAYSAVGGLPPRALGEDSALTEALDRAGFKVRHSMEVCVSTSCRFDGRAKGGAADTMRYRHAVPDAPCDQDIEPALEATRRALWKGILRNQWANGPNLRVRPAGLALSHRVASLFDGKRACPFEEVWRIVCAASSALGPSRLLRPADLPRQIGIAKLIVQHLRLPAKSRKISPDGRPYHEEWPEPASSA